MSDWMDGLAQRVLAHPDDVEKYGAALSSSGLAVVESSLIEAGNFLIADPAAFQVDFYDLGNVAFSSQKLGVTAGQDPYAMDFDSIAWKVRYEFGLGSAKSQLATMSMLWEDGPDPGELRFKTLRDRFSPSVSWSTGGAL